METAERTTGKRVAIVGAGISGLAAAYELSKAGVAVEVFERDATSGGLAGWFKVGSTTLEKFYHHLYNKDQHLIDFITEVGLGEHLIFRNTVTGVFYVNRIYRFSSPLDLLRYKPLSLPDRFRLGLLVLKAKMVKDWHTLDSITAREWIIKNASQAVYDTLWAPLFRSKFGRYSDQISAAWLWSKLVQRGGSRSKGGAEVLGYFKGGYGLLFKSLEQLLTQKGINLHFNSPVQQIVIEDERAVGVKTRDVVYPFDAVLATPQVPDYLSIAPGLPQANSASLGSIGFLANACLVLRLNRRLSETYWVNITDPDCPFVGVIEQTNLLGAEYYDGNHLAYISRYMDSDDPYYAMTAQELYAAYLPYLKKIFPHFSESWVLETYLWRELHAQPVVALDYRHKIPAAQTPIKGLYLSTMAQIFPEDRQMSNGVKLARETARRMVEYLRS